MSCYRSDGANHKCSRVAPKTPRLRLMWAMLTGRLAPVLARADREMVRARRKMQNSSECCGAPWWEPCTCRKLPCNRLREAERLFTNMSEEEQRARYHAAWMTPPRPASISE